MRVLRAPSSQTVEIASSRNLREALHGEFPRSRPTRNLSRQPMRGRGAGDDEVPQP